jgi:hypothetical protein
MPREVQRRLPSVSLHSLERGAMGVAQEVELGDEEDEDLGRRRERSHKNSEDERGESR